MWLLGESYHFCGWTWLARLTRKVYTYTIYQQYLPLSCLCCVCVCQTRRVSSFFFSFFLRPKFCFFFSFWLIPPITNECSTLLTSSFLSVSVFPFFSFFILFFKFQPCPQSITYLHTFPIPELCLYLFCICRNRDQTRTLKESKNSISYFDRSNSNVSFFYMRIYTCIDCLWTFSSFLSIYIVYTHISSLAERQLPPFIIIITFFSLSFLFLFFFFIWMLFSSLLFSGRLL